MGALIQFPDLRITPAIRRDDPATVIVLPVIKVEHVSVDIEKLRQAANRFKRKRKPAVSP